MKKQSAFQKKLDDKVGKCGEAARAASIWTAKLRNQILDEAAKLLIRETKSVLRANQKDLLLAKKSGLASAMMDRLTLNEKRIQAMAAGIQAVRRLSDPLGRIMYEHQPQKGLKIQR